MTGRLTGKACIITGTGGSIGRATAKMFAREGALVVGCDFDAESNQETADEVKAAGGTMVSLAPCDLTDPKICQQVVELALDTYGRVDVLFNNAAMAYFEPFGEMSDTTWYKSINEELNLVYLLTRAAWASLSVAGGSVLTTASAAGWKGTVGHGAAAHAAAKGAILAMTRQLAAEGARDGIRVNSVSPGLIETKQTVEAMKIAEWRSVMLSKPMLKRAGKPEEVASVALFLASDESSYITGADFRVDGGSTAC